MLRNPDGSYRQKSGSGYHFDNTAKRTEEVNLKCLYVSKGSLRMSMGWTGVHGTTALNEALGFPERYDYFEKTGTPGGEIRRRLSSLSTEAYYAALERDGYQVVEVEILLP